PCRTNHSSCSSQQPTNTSANSLSSPSNSAACAVVSGPPPKSTIKSFTTAATRTTPGAAKNSAGVSASLRVNPSNCGPSASIPHLAKPPRKPHQLLPRPHRLDRPALRPRPHQVGHPRLPVVRQVQHHRPAAPRLRQRHTRHLPAAITLLVLIKQRRHAVVR